MIKSDLARELTDVKTGKIDENVSCCEVKVDRPLSEKIGKPEGMYVTVESTAAAENDRSVFPRLSRCIADALLRLASSRKKTLTVGLGNRMLTADALGSLVLDKLIVENAKGGVVMRSIAPGVAGVTGIESYDVIRGVVDVIKPDLVIAVDSLCAAKVSRIGTSFQLSDAGITPGSGVKNARRPLNRDTLGVDVISIGVPMVVYASTISAEKGAPEEWEDDMVVTPKDVDILVENCAEIIAEAINIFSGNCALA